MDRFARQRGLVRQDKVADLKIAIIPSKSMPEAFFEGLTLLAGHLGVLDFPVAASRAEFTIHWPEDDELDDLPSSFQPPDTAGTSGTSGVPAVRSVLVPLIRLPANHSTKLFQLHVISTTTFYKYCFSLTSVCHGTSTLITSSFL